MHKVLNIVPSTKRVIPPLEVIVIIFLNQKGGTPESPAKKKNRI